MSENQMDIHIGRRLRFIRTMKGMSQEAVGEAIGVTFQQIQKYEQGINSIRTSRLYTLARVFSVPVSYFFNEEDKLSAEITRDASLLIRAFQNIPDEEVKKEMLSLVKALANSDSGKSSTATDEGNRNGKQSDNEGQ